jgi:hypothetical protein
MLHHITYATISPSTVFGVPVCSRLPHSWVAFDCPEVMTKIHSVSMQ